MGQLHMVVDLFEHFLKKDEVRGVEHFLNQGRDPDQTLPCGLRPVQKAMLHDATDSLISLLECGADPCLNQDLDYVREKE